MHVMMMNWYVWNGESVEKNDQYLADKRSLGVYFRDWVNKFTIL